MGFKKAIKKDGKHVGYNNTREALHREFTENQTLWAQVLYSPRANTKGLGREKSL